MAYGIDPFIMRRSQSGTGLDPMRKPTSGDAFSASRSLFAQDPLTGDPLQVMNETVPLTAEQANMMSQMYADDPSAKAAIGKQFIGGMFGSGRDQLSGPSMPSMADVAGTSESRAASPLGQAMSAAKEFGGTDTGKIMAQSLLDLQKRVQLQPILETEALFKAFNRPSNLAATAEKGALGSDILSDIEEGKTLQKQREQRESINDLVQRALQARIAKSEAETEKLKRGGK
jgi:hypothetical protein